MFGEATRHAWETAIVRTTKKTGHEHCKIRRESGEGRTTVRRACDKKGAGGAISRVQNSSGQGSVLSK